MLYPLLKTVVLAGRDGGVWKILYVTLLPFGSWHVQLQGDVLVSITNVFTSSLLWYAFNYTREDIV